MTTGAVFLIAFALGAWTCWAFMPCGRSPLEDVEAASEAQALGSEAGLAAMQDAYLGSRPRFRGRFHPNYAPNKFAHRYVDGWAIPELVDYEST